MLDLFTVFSCDSSAETTDYSVLSPQSTARDCSIIPCLGTKLTAVMQLSLAAVT